MASDQPSRPGPDREIVRRSFELALLLARHEGDGWLVPPGEVRSFWIHTARIDLHGAGPDQPPCLTYTGPWGRYLSPLDHDGVLTEDLLYMQDDDLL